MANEYRIALAQRSLLDYARKVMPGFLDGHPQRVLAKALECVETGALRRLMVSMPPRHGKSLLVTQLWPTWCMGRNPKVKVVQTSYAHPLSVDHSRAARRIFTGEAFHEVFPGVAYQPGRESQRPVDVARQAAEEWGTQAGGTYYAVGVGGSLTGRGADIAIIDDPVKNREEANSQLQRDRTWDWYQSTLYTRLSPGGAIVLVMTRWHPDDLAGRILRQSEEEGGEPWVVINMPAVDETGEALWPERWPLEELDRIRRAVGAFEWNSLYQGQPVLRGGNMLQVDRIVWHQTPQYFPPTGYLRAWDVASTEQERGNDPDATAGSLGALTQGADGQETFYLRDVVAGHWGALARDNMIVETAKRDGPNVVVALEAVGGYKDTYTRLAPRFKRECPGVVFVGMTGNDLVGDKVVRSQALESIMENCAMHVLQDEAWTPAWLVEATQFPSGAHDDRWDSTALCYHALKKRLNMGARVARLAKAG